VLAPPNPNPPNLFYGEHDGIFRIDMKKHKIYFYSILFMKKTQTILLFYSIHEKHKIYFYSIHEKTQNILLFYSIHEKKTRA